MTPYKVTGGFSAYSTQNQDRTKSTQATHYQNYFAGSDVFEKCRKTQTAVRFTGLFGPQNTPLTNEAMNNLSTQVPATKGIVSIFSIPSGQPAPQDKHYYVATADQGHLVDNIHLDLREAEEEQSEATPGSQAWLHSQARIDNAKEILELLAESAQPKSPTAPDAQH